VREAGRRGELVEHDEMVEKVGRMPLR